ncbi:hypothetical protein DM860_000890 [Cuscuta australis]|uniref:Uncharacterized protein n=1 Tax=Cuscuta australis TaxID=267555 RepID=A0A328DTE7_9ASTE|nr:hypothetical protein DM860_000890 [Cuscuta australis]
MGLPDLYRRHFRHHHLRSSCRSSLLHCFHNLWFSPPSLLAIFVVPSSSLVHLLHAIFDSFESIPVVPGNRYASSASVLGKLHLSGSPPAPHSSVYHTCFTIFIFVQYQWRKNIEISAGDSEGMLTAVRTQWRKNSTLWLGMLAIDSDEKDGSKTTSYRSSTSFSFSSHL